MDRLVQMATDLGHGLGRTEQYKALRRAIEEMGTDESLAGLRSDLERLEGEITAAIQSKTEPGDEIKQEYETKVSEMQTSSTYQRLVAAQTNFDKILMKVNETIEKGIHEGSESRIILP